MKKLLLKLLGFPDVKHQVSDLQTTIASMQQQLAEMDATYSRALKIVEFYEHADKNIPWYEDEELLRKADHEVWIMADRIRQDIKKKEVYTHPALKKRVIFHGGCLGCQTPLIESLGSCRGCSYFHGVRSDYPDLSKKYKQQHD